MVDESHDSGAPEELTTREPSVEDVVNICRELNARGASRLRPRDGSRRSDLCCRAYPIRSAPGIPASSVASFAPFALASCSRYPSVNCAGVRT